jgi:serine protease Do
MQEWQMSKIIIMQRWKVIAAGLLALAVITAGSISLPAHSAEPRIAAGRDVGFGTGFADLIEQVQPSVVTVEVNKMIEAQPSGFAGDPRAEEFMRRFFGQRGMPGPQQEPRQAQGVGSGFIIDDSGFIVTNNHVVEGADEVTVRLSDDRSFEAEVIGYDDKTDLALLKIDADDLTVSTLGDSDSTRVGDWVVAIGNPFGLGGTATVGIVSARGRDIRSGPYDDYMQIDAPINRGNSGGPVFNTNGEVVGVNTAIFSPNGGSVGIGFAIPANQVRDIVDELKSNGSIDRGWLGVQLQNIDDDLAESLGMKSKLGSLVSDVVPGSPAERAGIEVGDVILGYEGEEVADARALSRMVGSSDSGDKVVLSVLRGDDEIKLKVVLGDAETQIAANGKEQDMNDLGLTLAPLTDDLRERLGVDDKVTGAVVLKVEPNGLAAEQGIRRGDILMRADRQIIRSPADLRQAFADAKKRGRSSVPVLVKRGEIQQFASLPVA